jgi:hypothetical protein
MHRILSIAVDGAVPWRTFTARNQSPAKPYLFVHTSSSLIKTVINELHTGAASACQALSGLILAE